MDVAALVIACVLAAALYAWMAVALGAVFAKFGRERALAWIPVRRFAEAASVADLPTLPVWIARGVALPCWLALWVLAVLRAADAVAGSAGLRTTSLILFVIAVLGTLIGWVTWIVGSGRVELRLVLHTKLTWLAALMPPLWATLVGFGGSHAITAGPVAGAPALESEPEPAPEPASAPPAEADDATRAIQRVEQTPVTADNERETASDPAGPAEPREENMTTEEHDITGQVPRSYSPYDATPLTPVPLPDPPSPWGLDEDDDATFFAKRRRARWVLRVVGAEEYDLEDITTIGREGIRPIPGVLPIIDDTRTMSKLHARLRRESDNWFVTDLGSTNGTFVRDAGGNEYEVKSQTEAKVVGTLLLGDLEAVIVDQRELEA